MLHLTNLILEIWGSNGREDVYVGFLDSNIVVRGKMTSAMKNQLEFFPNSCYVHIS